MVTHVVGKVVVDGQNGIANTVVVSKQLVTQCHIRIAVLQDINHGEHSRIAATWVVDI